MSKQSSELILLAKVGSPVGIRGEVKVQSFCEDANSLQVYGALCDQTGKNWYKINSIRYQKTQPVVRIQNITDRTQADALKGIELYIPRDRLAELEDDDEFYEIDLVGLNVQDVDNNSIGTVIAVPDFGAGSILEIQPKQGETFYLPFSKDLVPVVDIEQKFIIIDLPDDYLI